MKTPLRLLCTVLLLLSALAAPRAQAAYEPLYIPGQANDGIAMSGNQLSWWKSPGVLRYLDVSGPLHFYSTSLLDGATHNSFASPVLAPWPGKQVWVDYEGRLTVADGLGWSSARGLRSTPEGYAVTLSVVAHSARYFYWTASAEPEFGGNPVIYRTRATTGTFPVEVFRSFSTVGIRTLESLNSPPGGSSFPLLSAEFQDGRLLCLSERFIPGTAIVGGISLERSTRCLAQFSSQDRARLYWLESDAGVANRFYLKSLPWASALDSAVAPTLHATMSHASATSLSWLTVTPDGTKAFFTQTTAGVTQLMRKNLDDTTAPAALVNVTGNALGSLFCTNAHVYWRKDGFTISRVDTGAAVLTRDLAAGGLEVVQVVQNAAQGCPLVAGKMTHARFFARIAASSLAEQLLSPPVVLHGTREGVELPGSPIQAELLPQPVLRSDAIDRTQQDVNAFLFRLPDSWTGSGALTLRAEINAGGAITETNFSNNASTATVTFVQSRPITTVFVPTNRGPATYYRTDPAVISNAMNYLEQILPVSSLRLVDDGGLMTRPFIPFYCWEGKYEVSLTFDDGWLLLSELAARKFWSSGSATADDQRHYVSLLRPFAGQVKWSGLSRLGDENINLVASPSIWFMQPLPGRLGPELTATAAQELIHNFGRNHVNCGTPAPDNNDPLYPYPTNTIGTAASGYLGFNPFNRRIFSPDYARDYMSYCGPSWTSDYTWKGVLRDLTFSFGATTAPASRLSPMATAAAGGDPTVPRSGLPQLYFSGFVHHDLGEAWLQLPLQLTTSGAQSSAASTIAGPPSSVFELHVTDDTGALLGKLPVWTTELAADEGIDPGFEIAAHADLPAGKVAKINLVHIPTAASLYSLSAGWKPPVVSVTAPATGEEFAAGAALVISWVMSDPDGDRLTARVRWSHDGGVSWRQLSSGAETSPLSTAGLDLPGGKNCLVEVAVSDGIHTTSARSGIFSYGNSAPTVTLSAWTSRGVTGSVAVVNAIAGESVTVRARTQDLEDGTPENPVVWNIIKPYFFSPLIGYGDSVREDALQPGDYRFVATVEDSAGAAGSATLIVRVARKHIETSPYVMALDGHAGERGYSTDPSPVPMSAGGGSFAVTRMVQQGGFLWVGVSGLPVPAAGDYNVCSLVFDLDKSGGFNPGTGDRKFRLSHNAHLASQTGDGTDWVDDDGAPAFEAAAGYPAGAVSTTWCAEFKIPVSELGGWLGQEVPAAVFFDAGPSTTHYDSAWPQFAFVGTPSSWAVHVFGGNQNDFADTDQDGLPDKWEMARFGDIKSSGDQDADGDGQTNEQEFTAGTDPKSPASFFAASWKPNSGQNNNGKFTAFGPVPPSAAGTLTWVAEPGRSYFVQASEDLENWDTVATGLTDGSYEPPPGSTSRRFFQVHAQYAR